MGFQFTIGSLKFNLEKFRSQKDPKEVFEKLERELGEEFQVMNSEFIFFPEQIISAIKHALRAFDRGENISNKLRVEILLYLSGKRQIKEAISLLGYNGGEGYLLTWSKRSLPEWLEKSDFSWSKLEKEKLRKLGISEEEIKACGSSWKDLPLEVIALLDVEK